MLSAKVEERVSTAIPLMTIGVLDKVMNLGSEFHHK
jgi:hypothetical protein